MTKAQVDDLGLCSPDWTRTSNRPINSRMLCQLSYGGPAPAASDEYWTRIAHRNPRIEPAFPTVRRVTVGSVVTSGVGAAGSLNRVVRLATGGSDARVRPGRVFGGAVAQLVRAADS